MRSNNVLKLFIGLLFIMQLSGCSTRGVTPEQMQKELVEFKLPESPASGKALVYIIFEGNNKPYSSGFYNAREISIDCTPITQERFENNSREHNSFLHAFTLGLLKDDKLIQVNKLGLLKPGQYKTIQLNPGYYEIGFNVTIPHPNMGMVKSFNVIKVEESKVYFVDIFSYSFYNRYAQSFTHSMGIVEIKDELRGRYYLSKNFHT